MKKPTYQELEKENLSDIRWLTGAILFILVMALIMGLGYENTISHMEKNLTQCQADLNNKTECKYINGNWQYSCKGIGEQNGYYIGTFSNKELCDKDFRNLLIKKECEVLNG